MQNKLFAARQQKTGVSLSAKIVHLLAVVFCGFSAGLISKYLDLLPHMQAWDAGLLQLFNGFSGVVSMFSFWAFTTTVVAVYSRNPLFAGIHSFCYLFSMNMAYYLYQIRLYGTSYRRQFVFWSVIAGFSLLAGAVLWYAKGKGLTAAFLTAIPVSVILCEALLVLPDLYRLISRGNFIYAISYEVVFIFCSAEILLLLFLLLKEMRQRLYALLCSSVLCIAAFFLLRAFLSMRTLLYR